MKKLLFALVLLLGGCATLETHVTEWWEKKTTTETEVKEPEATTEAEVVVSTDHIDPASVTWDEPVELAKWTKDVEIADLKISGDKLTWSQTGAAWVSVQKEGWGKPAIGNIWVIAKCATDGHWHGATWDWIGPGVRKKEVPDFAVKNDIHGPCLEDWAPVDDEQVCFVLSTFARAYRDAGNQHRSSTFCLKWKKQ